MIQASTIERVATLGMLQPATGSCEEANNVDACIVTTLDVITAFAVQQG